MRNKAREEKRRERWKGGSRSRRAGRERRRGGEQGKGEGEVGRREGGCRRLQEAVKVVWGLAGSQHPGPTGCGEVCRGGWGGNTWEEE